MPLEDNLLRMVVWQIVPKEALRSKRMRIEIKPGSAAKRRPSNFNECSFCAMETRLKLFIQVVGINF